MLNAVFNPKDKVVVGVVGKYVDCQDAYKSVFEALHHGAIAAGVALEIRKFESDNISDDLPLEQSIGGCDGYLVPGGFGERGWEGKVLSAKYCRENKIPYFGICLGMQIMLVDFARHVLGLKDAHSTEVNPNTSEPVVSMLSEQKKIEHLGGTMRLGAYPCELKEGSIAQKAYQEKLIWERHRHRYEFNNEYKKAFEEKGMLFSGKLEKGDLCEISEIAGHPWMVGVQFHPEFKSKPLQPHPLFKDFIRALIVSKKSKKWAESLA